ncbi:hypothetical protein ABIB99_009019 [Bradyrhizobium sp. LA6.1]|uniref:hypothetical protein n=1 Tax=Bradyrhizobium sp. LA6.1 TaxID=3156378 RepID=UPI003396480E
MTETKIEPTQTKSRAQRETRASKKLIVTRVKAKGIGKTVNIKTVKARALGRSDRRQSGRAV